MKKKIGVYGKGWEEMGIECEPSVLPLFRGGPLPAEDKLVCVQVMFRSCFRTSAVYVYFGKSKKLVKVWDRREGWC